MRKPRIAYIIDPRFPGGTSSAVAAELEVMAQHAHLEIHALTTAMFSGQTVAPQLQDVLNRLSLSVNWNSREIAADFVIFHNPSCLKFQDEIEARILAGHLLVIAHENFVHPCGQESYDVAKTLEMLERASFVMRRTVAPISSWNRSTIARWQSEHGTLKGWDVFEFDWFNICDFDHVAPTPNPKDRRGRHSRPGLEKFPEMAILEQCFSAKAEANIILGGDAFLNYDKTPAHWSIFPFRGLSLEQYFARIDFMIYYTAPTFRESFGRVLAEAIAAGKLVISDPETAETFQGAVVAAAPSEIDDIVSGYLAAPDKYVDDVCTAQKTLEQFSAQQFSEQVGPILTAEMGVCA